MNKFCSKTLRNCAVFMAFSLITVEASAQSCATPPTCESLGYDKTISQCGYNALKCPFDSAKVYCTTAYHIQNYGKLCEDGQMHHYTDACTETEKLIVLNNKDVYAVRIFNSAIKFSEMKTKCSDLGYGWQRLSQNLGPLVYAKLDLFNNTDFNLGISASGSYWIEELGNVNMWPLFDFSTGEIKMAPSPGIFADAIPANVMCTKPIF